MAEAKTIITRTFDAPARLVFEAWLDPAHLIHWHKGSPDWHTPFAESDGRAGGRFRIGYGSPDGKNDFTFEGVYNEVTPYSRIVFTIGDGRPVTLDFVEHDGKTTLTLVLTLEDIYSAEQQREGWTQILIHLGQYLARL
ncbi:MAG: SRPBCC domain-containing protein [Parvibaculum sp.]|uniref:SRPBCC domain-containing protein n=1 Tax=Parvibaculum sp. TaxID=2024848 RepID=UPI0025DBC275|nr:SRPBCC domain-containing protein [Parvibaculum sp.]MCE9650034.1 SRPBCC domain-containing protein [Parvibaculum sp.]